MKKVALLFLLSTLLNNLYSQNYTVLGNASSQNGCNCYQLTPDANNMAGAIFQNQTINLNNSFDYTFSVFLGCRNGNDAADGIVFVLTNNPNGLGSGGGGLGYGGGNQPFSLAVEFDTYQNSQDPSYDHIAIQSAGSVNHNVAGPVPALTNSGNIDNCQWYTVRIVWDVNTNTYSVYFNGVLRQSIVIPNMVATYFGGNPIVNWGWTAGTGGGTNDQRVCVLNTSSWVAGVNYQSCSRTLQFSDISTSSLGSIQSWAWNFGDGTTSTQQNPVHTYASNGTYTVSLTITDISGCTNTYTNPVTINPPITLTPSQTPPPCNGGSNGSVGVTASGGFGVAAGYGGYRYDWNGGANTTATYGGIPAGTYTVSVTDGVCSATGQYTLNQPPALSASTSHVDAPCAGNGSATIVISGGTPPYVGVNWAGTPGTTVSLGPGTYIADFRDANGCSALLQYRETISALPCGITSSISSTNVTCFGGNNGSATLTVTGGVAPINITWSNGATGATASNLAQGTYTYNFSDAVPGHAFSGSVTITQPGAAMAANITEIDMSCANSNDGQAIASVSSGGVAPYNYTWSGGQPNNASANNLSAGPISVTVTDSRGCTATATGTITGPPVFTLNITHIDDSCYQANLGSATANAAGGNPPYTYYWNNISSAQTNLNMGVGTYTVTVTDTRGCTVTGTTTINQPTALLRNITVQNINCNGGTTGSINLTPSGGVPGYSYTWSPATATGSNPNNLSAGQYFYTISDQNNCVIQDSATITQPATALSATSSHTNVTCNGANNGTITITIGGGTAPYTYQGNPVPAGTNTLTGLAAGPYSGTVTDANGCTVPLSETITEPGPQSATLNVTNVTCNGGNNGTATAIFVNATGAVTYNWNPGGVLPANRTSLGPNTYSVTATDANSCTASASATITEPAAIPLNVTTTDPGCYGGIGSATANPAGTNPFTFTWSSNSVNNATNNLPAGTYTVTAADVNSCNQTASFTINQPAGMTIQIQQTNVNCFNGNTGSIVLTVSGGAGPNYQYNWNPNVTTSNIAASLAAGPYRVTITDQAGCPQDTLITITQPSAAVSVNVQSTNITCFGSNNGSITINTTGGTPQYNYTWSPNVSTTNSATGLSAGSYAITVSDVNNCSLATNVTLSAPQFPLSATTSQTDLLCFQVNTGTATITTTGGTFPYGYSWSPNVSTTASANNLAAGQYNTTITDANNCTSSVTFTITQPTQLTVTEVHTNNLCNGNTNGDISLTATGGTPTYNYTWLPNVSTSNTASNLASANYSITITDANNCTALQSINITEPLALNISATSTDVLCSGQNNGTITATTTGGTSPYSYTATIDGVNFIPSSNGQFTNLADGTYTVLTSDNNQCTQSTVVTINNPSAITVVVNSTDASCYGYSDGQISASASGGNPAYTFSLSNNSQNGTGSFTGLVEGSYTLTVSDANNCSISASAVINQPDSVSVTVTPSPVEVKLGESILIRASTNQTSVVSYQWEPSFGLNCYDCANPTFSGNYSYTYTVTATNIAGCFATKDLIVTVNPVYDIFFPNVFTPNGDGANQLWNIFGNLQGIKQINVEVFDRIGEKVFESNDINFGWDGTYRGKDAPVGVYTYIAQIVWLNNHSDSRYKGTVTLLR
jgi:gliding motility-associated-like protein